MFGSSPQTYMLLSLGGPIVMVVQGMLMPVSRIIEVNGGIKFSVFVSGVFAVVGLLGASFSTKASCHAGINVFCSLLYIVLSDKKLEGEGSE